LSFFGISLIGTLFGVGTGQNPGPLKTHKRAGARCEQLKNVWR
jgi:hypothetical protein